MSKQKNNSYILFSIFIGVVTTLWHYTFGIGDQSEQLIFVYKALDSSFLANDSFANIASGFSVRTYFGHFVAFFARIIGVPAACFMLTLLSNIVLAVFTYLTGFKISGKELSGIFSAILVMTLTTINMGDINTLYATGISADRLALPLIFAAFYYAIQGKPLPVAIMCGLASLFHVLMGAVSGGILLSVLLIHNKLLILPINIKKHLVAWLIFIGLTLFVLIPFALSNQEYLESAEFIQIYANFRNPHHFLFNYIFTPKHLLRTLFFLSGALIAGYLLYKKNKEQDSILIYLLEVFLAIVGLCIFGYLFVEVYPTRIGVMLQAYRFAILCKWIALVVIGTYIGVLFTEKNKYIKGLYVFASILSPILLFATFIYELFCYLNKSDRLKLFTKPIFGLIIVVVYLLYKATNPETIVLFIWLVLALALIYLHKRWFYILLSSFVLFVGLNSFVLQDYKFKNANIQNWFSSNYRPIFTFEEHKNDAFNVCHFVEKSVMEDAVFLTPPAMAEFRTVAKRAAVVSFKMVPFTDLEIKDWKQRLDFCYGRTQELGFDAVREMSQSYRFISDEKLIKIQNEYGITHAVLFLETKRNSNVLYSNSTYKLVQLNN